MSNESEGGVLGEQLLDPFSFHGYPASRIKGLGGPERGLEQLYAFHTEYVEAEPGFANFILRFTGLTATHGTLQLWLNMLPTAPGSAARVANSERIQLNRIVQQNGVASIRFEGFRGMRYALHGQIVDETDAEAEALVVALDRPRDPNRPDDEGTAGISSAFGTESVEPATHLVTRDHATFETPVSQMCTAPQLREQSFRPWVDRLRLGGTEPLDQWRSAYAMQVLARYGMLADDAHGLVLGAGGGLLPAALAGHGVRVMAVDDIEDVGENEKAEALRALTRPELCDPDRFERLVDHRSVDRRAMPANLLNHDFLVCDGMAARFDTIKEGVAFVEQSLNLLRPGGLALHLLPFDPAYEGANREGEGELVFRMRDLERMALILISRRMEAAQITIDRKGVILRRSTDGGDDITWHGLIARRPGTGF